MKIWIVYKAWDPWESFAFPSEYYWSDRSAQARISQLEENAANDGLNVTFGYHEIEVHK